MTRNIFPETRRRENQSSQLSPSISISSSFVIALSFRIHNHLFTHRMASPLTAGFCERATSTEDVSECFDSVVQVLNVKKIASTDTTAVDRYRCVNSCNLL